MPFIVTIYIHLSIQDELENYSFKSIYRCDALNTEKHFPSLLLLVCQSAEQKKPDILFFNCETVKVSNDARMNIPLTNHLTGSGFTSDVTSIFLFIQAEEICEDISRAVSDTSKRKNKELSEVLRYSQSHGHKLQNIIC